MRSRWQQYCLRGCPHVGLTAAWRQAESTLWAGSRVFACVCRCPACRCGSADSWSPWVVFPRGPSPCWPACWCLRSRSSPPTRQLSPSSCPSCRLWYVTRSHKLKHKIQTCWGEATIYLSFLLFPVGDAAHQPPPHFDPVHHVRVIWGHASSGEPPQRHCLQLRPRADQRHGTTLTQTRSQVCSCTCCIKSGECNVSKLYYVIRGLWWWVGGLSELLVLFTPVFFFQLNQSFFCLFPPGESRIWGEPDRCGGGDVGHHHMGGSPLQPDWVPSLGGGQERHRGLITRHSGGASAVAVRRDMGGGVCCSDWILLFRLIKQDLKDDDTLKEGGEEERKKQLAVT